MPKEVFDQEGNIFIATKELVVKVREGTLGNHVVRLPCKDIDTVQEASKKLKEEFEKEGWVFGEDFTFEVNDL